MGVALGESSKGKSFKFPLLPHLSFLASFFFLLLLSQATNCPRARPTALFDDATPTRNRVLPWLLLHLKESISTLPTLSIVVNTKPGHFVPVACRNHNTPLITVPSRQHSRSPLASHHVHRDQVEVPRLRAFHRPADHRPLQVLRPKDPPAGRNLRTTPRPQTHVPGPRAERNPLLQNEVKSLQRRVPG